jgi:uncharacterized protein (TIGR03790 family)
MQNSRTCVRVAAWTVLCALALASRVAGQTADNLLLVVNSTSAASEDIGSYYARARAVPAANILRLPIDATEEISREVFERQIEAPIARWFNHRAAHDRILYIVLTKGVPLRVAGTMGRDGTVSSVDSELTLLYRKLGGGVVPLQGPIANPYFLGERPVSEARPFVHERLDIYLVARLDGFSIADVHGLIDRAGAGVRAGRIALDEKGGFGNDAGNRWLERSAGLLKNRGFGDRVLLETTSKVVAGEKDLLGYYSWGSNDPAQKSRDLNLGFVPGALAGMFVSTDARTFQPPPSTWTLGRWEDARTYFAGAPQSLIGDLIHQGVTGVAGHVSEPYLDATIRPDILFPGYLAGFNLIESFYLAMPYLSWQTVVVGDPLCAPFRTQALTARDVDPGVDPATEFPRYLSQRLLESASKATHVPEAAAWFVRGNGRMLRDDRTGAAAALERATILDARLVPGHLGLAALYGADGQHAKAIDRYRRVLALEPNNVAALNDLAFLLATDRPDAMKEALALAQRAHALSGNPSVADTLAWVLHLSGDETEARRTIAGAATAAPNQTDIQLHAAIIDAAAGATEEAERRVAHIVELNPTLEQDPEIQKLRAAFTKTGIRKR